MSARKNLRQASCKKQKILARPPTKMLNSALQKKEITAASEEPIDQIKIWGHPTKIPPRLLKHAFRPGQCGNPKGSKGAICLTTILKNILKQKIGKKTKGDLVMEALVKGARSSRHQHIQLIMDRVDGRVPISIQGGGPEAPAIQFNFAVATPGVALPPRDVALGQAEPLLTDEQAMKELKAEDPLA